MAEPDRPQLTLRRMHTKGWIPKAPNTNPEYVIRIAFSLQQYLHGRVLMLRYTYVLFLVIKHLWLASLHFRTGADCTEILSFKVQNA
jgi:hypothetical protein